MSTLDGSPLIKDNSLELNGFTFGQPSSFIRIAEDVCADDFGCFPDVLGSKAVFVNGGGTQSQLVDEVQFPLKFELFVDKQVLLSANATGDVLSLDRFEQHFSQIPEAWNAGIARHRPRGPGLAPAATARLVLGDRPSNAAVAPLPSAEPPVPVKFEQISLTMT